MQQDFLNISPSVWNIAFLVIRYVMVAVALAYIANVYIKRKNTVIDIKGRVTELQVETYKDIHRWLMSFKSVIAAPSQDEEHYRKILSFTKFQIGFQGMEYASFFDHPTSLLQLDQSFNRMLDKESSFVDDQMRQKLNDFKDWLDNVIILFGAFIKAERDRRWNLDEEAIEAHCSLACRIMGIALQKDVNSYFDELDEMMRDRLGDIRIVGVYSGSSKKRRTKKPYFTKSQLVVNRAGLMNIFILVHFEEEFIKDPSIVSNRQLFLEKTKEYVDCYNSKLEK